MNNQAEGNGLARQIEMISEEIFKHLSDSQHREQDSQARLDEKDRQLRILADHIGLLESQLNDYKHREQELQARLEEKNRQLNLEDRIELQESQSQLSDSQHREQELQVRLEEKDRQLRELVDRNGLQESRLTEYQHREQESQALLEEKDRQLGVLEDEIVLSQKTQLDEISQKLGYPTRRETCSLRNKANIFRYSPDNNAVLRSVEKPGDASIQPNLHSKSESYFHSARRTAERYAAVRKLLQNPYLSYDNTGIIFVKGPVEALDSRLLYDTFSAFGDILSCGVATYSDCSDPAGFACVCYDEIEAAEEALQQGVDGMLLNDELVYVELCMPGHPPCLSSITFTEEWDSEEPWSTDDESCLSPTQNL
jgi:hypothetical protein